MQPCAVLESLQSDLKEIVKFSCVPFEKTYKLGPGAEIELAINEPENVDSFKILVNSASGAQEAKLNGYRKIPALMVGLAAMKVTEYLSTRSFEPCKTKDHGGADELITLYESVRKFDASPMIPFKTTSKYNGREYTNFMVSAEGSNYRIELMTNHIYGESVKTIIEVDSELLIAENVHNQLERMIGEWIRPESVKSVKVVLADLERSNAENEESN